MTRRLLTRSTLAIIGIVVTGCGLTSCSSSKDNTFTQSVKGEDGSNSSVAVGANAKLPADFPRSEVPLPASVKLEAVVTGEEPPNHLFNLSYRLAGKSGRAVGLQYRVALDKAGYKISHYSSVGGSDGGFTQFNAVGKRWDISVVGGKSSLGDRNTLSVQVVTHGTLSDLAEIDSDSSSTTTTTIPIIPG